MPDTIKNPLISIYEGLSSKNPQLKEAGFDAFQSDMKNPESLQSVFNGLSAKNPQLKNMGFESFKRDMFPDFQDTVDYGPFDKETVEKYPQARQNFERWQGENNNIKTPQIPERETSFIPEVISKDKLVQSVPATQPDLSFNNPEYSAPKISDSFQSEMPTVIPQGTGNRFQSINIPQLNEEVGGAKITPEPELSESQKEWAKNNPRLNKIFSIPGMGFIKEGYIGTKKMIGGLGTTLDFIAQNISNNITGGMQVDEQGNVTAPWEKGYKEDKSDFYKAVRKYEEETPVSSGGATAFIWQIIPQTAALAATVMLRNPSVSKAYLASMYGSSFGNGVESYDDYVKETGKESNETDRLLVGLGYGTAEYIGEKIGLDYFMPKGYGKVVAKALDASPNTAKEIGKQVLENYAEATKQPVSSIIKKIAIGSQVEAGQEDLTEGMQIAIDKWVTGRDVKGKEIRDRFIQSHAGGTLMGAVVSPFAQISQSASNIQRRRQQGTVTISIDEQGLPVELIKDKDKLIGIRPDGEEVKNISQETKNKAVSYDTQIFESAINEFNKTNTITTATIEGQQPTDQSRIPQPTPQQTREAQFTEARNKAAGMVQYNFDRLKHTDGNLHTGYDLQGNEYIVLSETPGGMAIVHDANGQKKPIPVSDIKDRKVQTLDEFTAEQMGIFDQENSAMLQPKEQSTFKMNGKMYSIQDVTTDGKWIASELDAEGSPSGQVIEVEKEYQDKMLSQLQNNPEMSPELNVIEVGGKMYSFTPANDGTMVGEVYTSMQEAEKAKADIETVLGNKDDITILSKPNPDPMQPDQFTIAVKPKTDLSQTEGENLQFESLLPDGDKGLSQEMESELQKETEPSYSFKGQPIDKKKAMSIINIAADLKNKDKLAGLQYANDPELDELVEKHFPKPVASFKIGNKKYDEESAVTYIEMADTQEELDRLKIENIEAAPEVQKAYDAKMAEFEKVEKAGKEKENIEHNKLVRLVQDYNNKSDYQRKQTNTSPIVTLASQLGYITRTDAQGKLIVTDKGTEVRMRNARTNTDEEIQAHKSLNEYSPEVQKTIGNFMLPVEVEGIEIGTLTPKEVKQAILDIQAGKKTVSSNSFLDEIEKIHNSNVILLKGDRKTGMPGVEVPLAEYFNVINENLTDNENDIAYSIPENVADAINNNSPTYEELDSYEKLIPIDYGIEQKTTDAGTSESVPESTESRPDEKAGSEVQKKIEVEKNVNIISENEKKFTKTETQDTDTELEKIFTTEKSLQKEKPKSEIEEKSLPKTKQDDSRNIRGIPSPEQGREAIKQTRPDQTGSRGQVGTSGDVQGDGRIQQEKQKETEQRKTGTGNIGKAEYIKPGITTEQPAAISQTVAPVVEQEESQTERFNLKPTKSLQDLKDNVNSILEQYSGRNMAAIQVEKYLNEFPKLGKQYLAENSIKTKDEYKAHLAKLQTKAREGKGKERQETIKEIEDLKTQERVGDIIDMALKADAEMQKQIEQEAAKVNQNPTEAQKEAEPVTEERVPEVEKTKEPEIGDDVSFTYLDGSDVIGQILSKEGNIFRIKGQDGKVYRVKEGDVRMADGEIRFKKEDKSSVYKEAAKHDNFEDFVDAYNDKNFRDSHTAPGFDDTPVETKLNDGGDFSLTEVASGYHNQPDDYFAPRVGARYYGYDDIEGMQSYVAISNIIRGIKAGRNDLKITTYRAVPKDINNKNLIDGDWVTFSREYAVGHGEHRFGEGEYKIIKQEVSPEHLWWDGNDINEWGYDTGQTKTYGRYDLKRIWDEVHSIKERKLTPAGYYSAVENAPVFKPQPALLVRQDSKQKIVDKLNEIQSSAKNARPMYLFSNQAELEAAAEKAGAGKNTKASILKSSKGAMAFYDPITKAVYINTSKINNVHEAVAVWLHEMGIHAGLENIIPETEFNGLMEAVYDFVKTEAETNQYYKALFDEVTGQYSEGNKAIQGEEMLAWIGERAGEGTLAPENKALWKKIVDYIKDLLKRIYGVKNIVLTENDVMNIVNASIRSNFEGEIQTKLPKGIKKVGSFKTEEGKFSYYDTEYAPRGRAQYFTVLEDKKGWIVRNVILPESERGKGIATKMYEYLNEQSLNKTGNPLRSSRPRTIQSTGEVITELSKDGEKLWERLVSKGLAVKTGDKLYEFITEPKSGIRSRIIGEKGAGRLDKAEEATTRLDNLAIAREMETSGKNAKTIRLATGWEKGVDGKWRYEVSDEDISFKKEAVQELKDNQKLANAVHTFSNINYRKNEDGSYDFSMMKKGATSTSEFATYRNIPDTDLEYIFDNNTELISKIRNNEGGEGMIGENLDEAKELNVEFEHYVSGGQPLSSVITSKDLFKSYPQLKDVIVVYNPDLTSQASFGKDLDGQDVIQVKSLSGAHGKSILLHEVQHYIQDIEGFAKGGNLDMARNYESNNGIQSFNGYKTYQRLAGEVESRNVQSRMNMTPEERRNTLLSETEDVDREDQIVLMNGLGVSNLEDLSLGEKPNSKLVYQDLLTRIGKKKFTDYLNKNGLSEEEIQDALTGNDEYWIDQYLSDEYQVSVNSDGYVQFDELTPQVKKLIGNNKILLYHHTSDAIINSIAKDGIISTGANVNRNNYRNLGVYLTTEYSGNAVEGYKNRAWNFHGGNPITLEISTTVDQLKPDDNDSDLKSGRSQFVVDKVNPEDIINLSEFKPKNTITINGVERSTLNSNGKPIAATEEGIRNFYEWFQNSKVTDEQGRPLVVYHGTNSEFTEFKFGRANGSGDSQLYFGKGFYFTNDRNTADSYSDYDKEKTMDVYLKIDNPFISKDSRHSNPWTQYSFRQDLGLATTREIQPFLIENGYDGVVHESGEPNYSETNGESDVDYNEYVVFEPSQIKSATGNIGTFSPKSNDIRLKKGEPVTEILTTDELTGKKQIISKGERIRQLLQDKELALKNWLNDVRSTGVTIRDFENPYQQENLSHGRILDKMNRFTKNEGKSLIESVSKFIKAAGIDVKEASNYMIAKHGPERNKWFWEQDVKNSDKDFSGLTELRQKVSDQLIKEGNTTDGNSILLMPVNDFAKWYTDRIEAKAGTELTEKLWDAVNKATDFTLTELKNGGFISNEQYETLKARYKNYIPLRGWEQTGEEFDYAQSVGQYSNPIKKAEGRRSVSDDPLAYIMNMANSAVISSERNRIKQYAGNLVRNNIESLKPLVTFNKTYFVKTGDKDSDGNDIIYETIDRPAQELFDLNRVTIKTPSAYKSRKTSGQAKEFEVEYYENGQKMVLVFEGSDPAVARALNNTEVSAAIDSMNKAINAAIKIPGVGQISVGGATRYIGSVLTSLNPAFAIPNMARDIPLAMISEWVEGTGMDVATMFPNMKRAEGAIRRSLRGNPSETNEADQKYQDFLKNGGATGFVHLKSVDNFKEELLRDIKNANSGKNAAVIMGKGFRTGLKYIEQLSEWSENITRFAVYLNHIDRGETPQKAAFAAKNSTVNFNKKGRLTPTLNGLFAFFNAAIQASDKYFNMWGKNWGKMAAIHSVLMVQGFMNAMLLDLFGGEDDDEIKRYDKVSDFIMKNYMVIPIPYTDRNVTIPMPQVLRAFHGLGVDAYNLISGRKNVEQVLIEAFSGIPSDIIPVDVGGILTREGDLSVKPFTPTVMKPFVELMLNENFMGMPIYPEAFTLQQKALIADTRRSRKNVNKMAQSFTDFLYNAGGGDESGYRYIYKDGEIKKIPALMDINPHTIEYLFESYFGGTGKFFNDLYKTSSGVLDVSKSIAQGNEFENAIKEIDVNMVPVVNRFIRQSWGDPVKTKFYEVKTDIERKIEIMKDAKKRQDWEKFDKIQKEIGVQIELYKSYDKQIEKLDEAYYLMMKKNDEKEAKLIEDERRDVMKNVIKLENKK